MTNPLKALLIFVIAVTERALRTEPRPRCIRGGSLAAREARRRRFARGLDATDGASDSVVVPAKP